MNPKLMAGVISAVCVSILVLAVASVYSAWVASNNHHNSCARTDLILDTFHDVIILALMPAPGQTFDAQKVAAIATFESKAFTRIDQARC